MSVGEADPDDLTRFRLSKGKGVRWVDPRSRETHDVAPAWNGGAMRAVVRAVVLVVIVIILAAPASAKQIINYAGTTSAPRFHKVRATVVKQNDGDRRVQNWIAYMLLTCQDASTERWGVGFGGGFLGDNGEFEVELNNADSGFYLHVVGSIRWGKGSGTAIFNRSRLTDDGQDAELCSTGDLTWTVDRVIKTVGSAPRSTRLPDSLGFLKLRVRHGVAEVTKLVEP